MQDQQLNHNPFRGIVLGDFHDYICKAELDNCFSKWQAIHVGYMLNNRFDLDGFRIYQSSIKEHKVENVEGNEIVYQYKTRGYHIIWNRKVNPLENKAIKSWLYMHLKNNWNLIEELNNWTHMQNIKQTDTLRIGFKGRKKPPREVYRYGNQDKMIKEFQDNRQFILNFMNEENKNRL